MKKFWRWLISTKTEDSAQPALQSAAFKNRKIASEENLREQAELLNKNCPDGFHVITEADMLRDEINKLKKLYSNRMVLAEKFYKKGWEDAGRTEAPSPLISSEQYNIVQFKLDRLRAALDLVATECNELSNEINPERSKRC